MMTFLKQKLKRNMNTNKTETNKGLASLIFSCQKRG